MAAVFPRQGGDHPARHTGADRERILAAARRVPDRERDGTAAWSLRTPRRALRQSGLPQINTATIRQILRGAGFMMPTLSRLAADALVILHLAFILFVIFGGWLAPRWPRLIWLHLPAVIWGVLVEWMGWNCPLTPLENHLRFVAGEAGYTGGFIDRYLLPLIYPAGLTREAQLLLGAGVVALNILVYGFVLIRWFHRRRLRNVSAGPGDRSPRQANGQGLS